MSSLLDLLLTTAALVATLLLAIPLMAGALAYTLSRRPSPDHTSTALWLN